MSLASSTDGFALDMQGLANLRRTAQTDRAAGAKEASKQFEAMFLQMMLKSMRAAIPKSDLDKDSQTSLYTEMLDEQWSQRLAGKGLGLAEQLERQLGASTGQRVTAPSGRVANVQQTFAAWQRRAVGEVGARAAHVEDFVQRLAGPARQAARSSGVPAELILAQAALETDWGRRKIPTGSGEDSHNLFGIKAGGRWRGASTEVMTTEFQDGEMRKQLQSFRAYPSDEAALADYTRLLGGNANYAGVLSARDPLQAAHALQKGGYATDPDYASKLIAVMATIGPLRPPLQTARLEP
ncbi:flagellar assembly peptidoglycan hydrolase FlgJ [Pseudomonas sp. RIT-To-2]|uniref:flagellar assembly peptidoglycan hydrolase FlgJ n=1 Tax=Pseudomonas sp. RIT-To-2 TaxID=3462541 RepID=UPI0024136F87